MFVGVGVNVTKVQSCRVAQGCPGLLCEMYKSAFSEIIIPELFLSCNVNVALPDPLLSEYLKYPLGLLSIIDIVADPDVWLAVM